MTFALLSTDYSCSCRHEIHVLAKTTDIIQPPSEVT